MCIRDRVKALCDGKIDAFGYSVGFPNGAMEQAATCGAKALPINLTGGPVQGLIDGADYYAAATIPKGTYTGQKKDVTTFPFNPLKSVIPDFALAQIWKGSL